MGHLIKRILALTLIYYTNCTISMQQLFTDIYHTNLWGDPESASGSGSNLQQTVEIRKALPILFEKLQIKILLDAPCGDFNWMRKVDLSFLDSYIGIDIVGEIIQSNQKKFLGSTLKFLHLNIVEDELPHADAILCRDCLVHFRYADIKKTLINFKKTGAKYLITTTFTVPRGNHDFIPIVDWRPLNLNEPPFNFPKPIALINENCTEFGGYYLDKSLGVWLLDNINIDFI